MSWTEGDGFKWRIDIDERKKLYTALVRVQLPANVNKKNLQIVFEPTHLKVACSCGRFLVLLLFADCRASGDFQDHTAKDNHRWRAQYANPREGQHLDY